MSSEYGVAAPTAEERLLDKKAIARLLLTEEGPWLWRAYQGILEEMKGRELQPRFYLYISPAIDTGAEMFERYYSQFGQVPSEYWGHFPRGEVGLTIPRGQSRLALVLGHYPVLKLDRFNQEVRGISVEYPLVVVSPNREVLNTVWTSLYRFRCGVSSSFQRDMRSGLQAFNEVFDPDIYPGEQYPRATVLEPKKWRETNARLLELLVPCLVEAAVKSLTASVNWSDAALNPVDDGSLDKESTYQIFSAYEFRELLTRASEAAAPAGG